MDKALRWDFDCQDWKTITAVLFGTQVVRFLVSPAVDAIWS